MKYDALKIGDSSLNEFTQSDVDKDAKKYIEEIKEELKYINKL